MMERRRSEMAVGKGFWFSLGVALSGVLAAIAYILTLILRGGVPEDLSKNLDDARKKEEERIREQIKRENDQQLADHANQLLAGDKGNKEKKK
jgi:hypothetical protein